MTALARLVVFTGYWLGGDVALVAVWRLALWLRGPRVPVQYGPLPVPLVVPLVSDPVAAMLAVDAVSWSFAETLEACDG